MTVLKELRVEKSGATTNRYRCDWCGFEWEQTVRVGSGQGSSRVSSQVQCKRCHNFIPTWKEKKKVR